MNRMTTQIFLVFCCACFSAAEAAGVSVRAGITNIAEEKGVVRVFLFARANARAFPDGKAFEERELPADFRGVSVTFQNLEPGDYAIAVFHDKNGNGKMDTTAIGFPKEPYGISGKRPKTKPRFERSKFAVDSEDVDLQIELR